MKIAYFVEEPEDKAEVASNAKNANKNLKLTCFVLYQSCIVIQGYIWIILKVIPFSDRFV